MRQFHKILVKSKHSVLSLNTAKKQAVEFMKALSTAHECIIDQFALKHGIISYQGQSPDEVALVEMAQRHGFEMVH